MSFVKKNSTVVFAAMTVCALFLGVYAYYAQAGQEIKEGMTTPDFVVKSGDERELSLDMIEEEIIIIFYETQDVLRQDINLKLKTELRKLFAENPGMLEQIFILPVADCTPAFWPFIGIWKNALKEHSRKEGVRIYGDWTGRMKSDYGTKGKKSAIIIIDGERKIRYFGCDKAEDKEIEKIKCIIIELFSGI